MGPGYILQQHISLQMVTLYLCISRMIHNVDQTPYPRKYTTYFCHCKHVWLCYTY